MKQNHPRNSPVKKNGKHLQVPHKKNLCLCATAFFLSRDLLRHQWKGKSKQQQTHKDFGLVFAKKRDSERRSKEEREMEVTLFQISWLDSIMTEERRELFWCFCLPFSCLLFCECELTHICKWWGLCDWRLLMWWEVYDGWECQERGLMK